MLIWMRILNLLCCGCRCGTEQDADTDADVDADTCGKVNLFKESCVATQKWESGDSTAESQVAAPLNKSYGSRYLKTFKCVE